MWEASMADKVVLPFQAKAQGISDTDKAWAAGFFEGEGSVRIVYSKAHRAGGERSVSLKTHVAQVDKSPLMWLQCRWEGKVKFRKSEKANGQDFYDWRLSARQAARFLRDIRPFIVRNRVLRRIELALRFQDQKIRIGVSSAAYWNNQFYFFNEMKKLNIRGAAGNASADDPITEEQEPPDDQLRFLL
jgi:hypothetical protein